MFKLRKTFAGGYIFKRFEGELVSKIADAPMPEKVIIPLRQGFGKENLPVVKVGDKVCAGQLIGASDYISSPVHASINGVVKAITKIKNEYGRLVNSVIIESEGDSSTGFNRLTHFSPQYRKKKPDEVRILIYRSGVAALGAKGIPTQFKSSPLSLKKVSCVIVKAIHSLPFSLTNEVFMKKRLHQFINGLGILNYALNRCPVYLAINRNDKELIKILKKKSQKLSWLHILSVKPKYPIEHKTLLYESLFPRMLPKKRRELAYGAVVLDPQEVVKVYEAVVEGRPMIDKIVALGGNGFIKNIGLRVRIGTSIEEVVNAHLKKEFESQVVVGNFLSNKIPEQLNFPVNKNTSNITALREMEKTAFLAPLRLGLRSDSYTNTFLSKLFPFFSKKVRADLNGEPGPCISCGYCESICPSKLLPIYLVRLVEKKKNNQAIKYGVDNCIECGLCSYVCPSKIELLSSLQRGKRMVKKTQEEKAHG